MLLFANKARSTLTNSVTSAAGQVATVTAGEGALFVGLGGFATSTTDPMRCVLTAVDGDGNDTGVYEIVEIVRSGDNLTLQSRGLEGTSAAAWGIGTIIECRATAGVNDQFPKLARTDTATSGLEQSQIQTLTVAPTAASSRIAVASGGKIVLDAGMLGNLSGGGHVVGNIGWVSLAANAARTLDMLIAQEAKLDLTSGTVTNAIAQESQLNDNTASVGNLFLNYNHVVQNHANINVIAGSTFAIDSNSAAVTYATGLYVPTIPSNTGSIGTLIGLFFPQQTAPNIAAKKVIWNLDSGAVIDTVGPIIQNGESVAVGGALVLAADNAAIASTTLQNVPNLAVPLVGGQKYVIEWDVDLTIATTTETFGVGVTLPAGATGNFDVVTTNGAPNTGAATVKMAGAAIGTAIASGQFGNPGSATALVPVRVTATVTVGATPGSATLQLNGSTTGNIVVKQNSSVVWTRV